jgi:Fe-S oxidoreductase
MLQEQNLAELGRSRYEAIVTTDPHSYNTLKHEYLFEGGEAPLIYHYSELLDMMLADGTLRPSRKLGLKATFHDPCYLGRYNGIYDAPRHVITATGCTLVEMPHHHDRAICCGAGGGRIWMDEGSVTERPSERRIMEAADTGADIFVVACPKDMTMYKDAVKTTGMDDQIEVKDLVDLLYDCV